MSGFVCFCLMRVRLRQIKNPLASNGLHHILYMYLNQTFSDDDAEITSWSLFLNIVDTFSSKCTDLSVWSFACYLPFSTHFSLLSGAYIISILCRSTCTIRWMHLYLSFCEWNVLVLVKNVFYFWFISLATPIELRKQQQHSNRKMN